MTTIGLEGLIFADEVRDSSQKLVEQEEPGLVNILIVHPARK